MGKRLYVGNLPYSTTEDDLRDLFAEAGEVVSAAVVTDRETGQSKGFGFVEMATDEEANKAIEALNNREINRRRLTVAEARPRESGGGGGYGGGGRGGDRGGRGGGGGRGGYGGRDDRW